MSSTDNRISRPDLLAELAEQVIVGGRTLGVPPEVLLQLTAEAFEFLAARAPRPPAVEAGAAR